MSEEIITAIRYSPTLRREVTVRLTYAVSDGPRPGLTRWFLVKEELQNQQDSQGRSAYSVAVNRPQATPLPWAFSVMP